MAGDDDSYNLVVQTTLFEYEISLKIDEANKSGAFDAAQSSSSI